MTNLTHKPFIAHSIVLLMLVKCRLTDCHYKVSKRATVLDFYMASTTDHIMLYIHCVIRTKSGTVTVKKKEDRERKRMREEEEEGRRVYVCVCVCVEGGMSEGRDKWR